MITSRREAKAEIEKLVRYFDQNFYQIKHASFNEAQTRQQLIDPFFEALGWDVRNKNQLPPYALEVMPEGRVKTWIGKESKEQYKLLTSSNKDGHETLLEYISDDEYKADQKMASKKPDYRFRINGTTKFFVEAKKPSVDLQTSLDAIFQIKRYGFSARVPVSILTDFEEFRVFDCTRKPFYDKPKAGVLKEFDFTFKQYVDEFDKLYDIFSRDAVLAGSLEEVQRKYLMQRKGEFELDKSFLDDLSDWRTELAQDIAKHPKNRRILKSETLNECVQRILDRIIFLRVCEDRGIEETGTLLAILRIWQDHPALSLYEQFNKLIHNRRALYNGLLFAEHESEEIVVGDKILEKIFKNVNYPNSPYHFDEIGVEILGSIYERFLGKTIRLTAKQVRIEEKPEVRKAGGVYYTPKYIVDYIVENTVGKLLAAASGTPSVSPPLIKVESAQSPPSKGGEVAKRQRGLGLTPKQISKLKIIDIACGSGSFLLGAFQKLIDYHVEYYTAHPKEIKEEHGMRDAYHDANGQLRLSSRKKREILLNNIYGVDIDPQAVEVTQMSLYLKVLEDENDATLNKQTTLALHEVLLPSLKNNIKCGNSLIGSDFQLQENLFDVDALQKIKPFDWDIEFDEIMSNGGFDCVIGNPPYVRPHNLEDWAKEYFWNHYKTFVKKSDLYCCFLQKAIYLTKNEGYISYIISDGWLRLDSFQNLRKYILSNCLVRQLTELPNKVFEDATVKTGIVVLERWNNRRTTKNEIKFVKYDELKKIFSEFRKIDQNIFDYTYKNMFDTSLTPEIYKLKNRLIQITIALSELVDIRFGLKTGDDSKFLSTKKISEKYKKLLRGEDVQRFNFFYKGEYVWYVPEKMREHRQTARPGEAARFEQAKILIKDTSSKLGGTLDYENYYVKDVLILTKKYSSAISLEFILAILNSSFMRFYYETSFPTIHVQNEELSILPIHTIDFNNPSEKKTHDDLVTLVDRMLELNKQLQKTNFDSEREPIERQIKSTDNKIDALVYELYGLTEEEIKIVEGEK